MLIIWSLKHEIKIIAIDTFLKNREVLTTWNQNVL